MLLVEDDQSTAVLLRTALSCESDMVDIAGSVLVARELVAEHDYAVVVLDLGLPDQTGLSLLRELRQVSDAPVLVVSGIADVDAKLAALSSGADDYLTKPFHIRELIARIVAVRRRADRSQSERICAGPITLDLRKLSVEVDGVAIHATRTEFSILEQLVRRRDRVVSKAQLALLVHGSSDGRNCHLLTVFISQLRRKLGAVYPDCDVLETIWGEGYLVRSQARRQIEAVA
jgi:two-component system, cell cycle response regulator CtrA